jgi:long-chain acyl-CoA synthetase
MEIQQSAARLTVRSSRPTRNFSACIDPAEHSAWVNRGARLRIKNSERFGPEAEVQTQLNFHYLVSWLSCAKARQIFIGLGLMSKGGTTMNFGDLLSASAERNPRKACIVLENESISYEQLDRSTTSLARWFLRQGRKPGDRIAIHWPNSIEVVKLLFACFKAGMIPVPVNVRMKAPEIAYVLQHSQAVMYFVHPDLASVAEEASEGCAGLRTIHTTLEGLNEGDPDIPLPAANDHDPALLLYTSGTTARPKGVTHSHRTLLEIVKLVCLTAPDSLQTVLVMTQMAYISAICFCLLPAVVTGGTCVLARAFDAPLVLDLIERFQCSCTFGLPAMVQLLVEEQARKPREVRSLRTFTAGGDCVPVSTQERFQALFGIPLREGYGMTEIGLSVFNPADAVRSGSLGKALEGIELRVVDSDGKDTPEGGIGEIAVRSPAIFAGYWDDPAATSEALRDGWLLSGDLARRDADGYLWFEGRKKEIIIRDGLNISPQDVEKAIYDHPAVLEVAVIGMPDPIGAHGERLLAFVTVRDGLVTDEQELIDHARERLADFKVPERIVFLKDLPKGITGKVQRRALKQMSSTAVEAEDLDSKAEADVYRYNLALERSGGRHRSEDDHL